MKSGIYKITNTVNGKFYIGSAVDLSKRKSQHKHYLIRDRHNNKHLQAAWNKYGEEAFAFETLATCRADDLLQVEQAYLEQLSAVELGYNICPTAGSPMLGRVFTEEHRAKLSAANKGQVNPYKGMLRSREISAKISEAKKGKSNGLLGRKRNKFSPETISKMSAAKRGVVSPRKGATLNAKTKEKLRAANLGKKHTLETKRRMVEAQSMRREREAKARMIAEQNLASSD